jgi:predicted metal-dependent hydrolase
MAHEGLSDIASEKAGDIKKIISSIKIRDTKTRWGSCAKDGSLSFSWRLIFAPYHTIDYVVAHEVAHLAHMNHGPKFWALCEKLSLNYTGGKEWLKANGNELMRYGHRKGAFE